MPIVPDDKNWTWVLERTCPECGFEAEQVDVTAIPDLIRANAGHWPSLLDDPLVSTRPDESTWSALEYGCHVRDVFRLYAYRLDLMLTQDGPRYPDWDQDETAIADHYADQDPGRVADELAVAAAALAEGFRRVCSGDWERTGFRSDGAAFTIASFARYLIHDPVHHLRDVATGYERLRSR
jgi:hypothetical protein